MFLTALVVALVSGVIGPCLNAIAVLAILFPVSDVLGAVKMLIGSSSLGLVIVPVALVDIAVCVDKSSLAVRLIVFPVSDVLATIFPDLGTFALTMAIFHPLSVVNGTVVKLVRGSVDQSLGSWGIDFVENEWPKANFSGPSISV